MAKFRIASQQLGGAPVWSLVLAALLAPALLLLLLHHTGAAEMAREWAPQAAKKPFMLLRRGNQPPPASASQDAFNATAVPAAQQAPEELGQQQGPVGGAPPQAEQQQEQQAAQPAEAAAQLELQQQEPQQEQPQQEQPTEGGGTSSSTSSEAAEAGEADSSATEEPAGPPPLLLENPDYPLARPDATSAVQDLPAFAEQLWERWQARLVQRWGNSTAAAAAAPTAAARAAESSATNSSSNNATATLAANLRRVNATAPVVVFLCNRGDPCGGWGDRLRGITALFLYSLLTDSAFDIQLPYPVDIAEVYPLVATRRPHYRANSTANNTFDILNYGDLGGLLHVVGIREQLQAEAEPVLFLKCNAFAWQLLVHNPKYAEQAALYGLTGLTTFDMYRLVAQLYFSKLTTELQQQVDAYLPELNARHAYKIGVQLRTGGYGKHFAEMGEPGRVEPQEAAKFADRALEACQSQQPQPDRPEQPPEQPQQSESQPEQQPVQEQEQAGQTPLRRRRQQEVDHRWWQRKQAPQKRRQQQQEEEDGRLRQQVEGQQERQPHRKQAGMQRQHRHGWRQDSRQQDVVQRQQQDQQQQQRGPMRSQATHGRQRRRHLHANRQPAKQRQQPGRRCAIFLTSDAEEAVAVFRQRVHNASLAQGAPEVAVVTTAGPASHLERSSYDDEGQRAVFLKNFLDWELLRRSDFLVISRSGYGETAAWWAAVPALRVTGDDFMFGWDRQTFTPYDTVIGMPGGAHP